MGNPGREGQGDEAADAVAARTRALFVGYANTGEVAIGVSRVLLCMALLVRYCTVSRPFFGDSPLLVVQRMSGIAVGIAVSLWVVARGRERKLGLGVHLVCTAMDYAICFLGLRLDVLNASGMYDGLLRMPDTAFLVVLVFGSALRLYWRAIALSAVLAPLALWSLVRLDETVNGVWLPGQVNDLEMIALQMAAAVAAAVVSAWAVRRAIRGLALEIERVTRGRRYLTEILREHHDLRTLLSTARLELGLLRRGGRTGEADRHAAAAERAVTAIADIVDGIKSRTFGELVITDDIAAVDPVAIIDGAVAVARSRFPDVAIRALMPADAPRVLLFGGDRALAHVVLNVLVNACEGDGAGGASRVDVRLAERADGAGRRVLLEVADDGPGFRPELLAASLRGGLSTKAGGTGIGLSLAAGIVEASGGALTVRNGAATGACVAVQLRVKDQRKDPQRVL
jgi:signal transduction histidine kinase